MTDTCANRVGVLPRRSALLELEENGFNGNVTAEDGCASVFMMKGRRKYMEDNYAISLPYKITSVGTRKVSHGRKGEVPGLFGVFDGHGGWKCSQYCRDHLLGRALEFIKGGEVLLSEGEGEEKSEGNSLSFSDEATHEKSVAASPPTLWSHDLPSRWLKKALQYAFTQTDREVCQFYPQEQVCPPSPKLSCLIA